MKKTELFKQFQQAKDSGKEILMVILYIHMPTGEEEIICNPNVEEKMKYIDKTYNEDLVHANCSDIYIRDAIFSTYGGEMEFGEALDAMKQGAKVKLPSWGGYWYWDSDKETTFQEVSKLKRKIHFIGNDAKFMISKNFPINSNVTLELYGRKNDEMVRAENINYHGFFDEYNLLHELHRGGFGLVWTEDMYWREYMRYNTSFKISTYLRAGIPLIVHESISCRKMIEDNHWGIIVNSLAEAVEKVKAMTVKEYNSYVEAIQGIKYPLEHGYFTKKVLVDSVYKLFVH